MSNLGGYQTLTSAAKKVGGPENLVIGIAVAGFAAVRAGETGARYLFRRLRPQGPRAMAAGEIYIVRRDGDDVSGLQLALGDSYRVLERDDDAVLIEVIGRNDNPHFVSGDFLAWVSDFPAPPDTQDA